MKIKEGFLLREIAGTYVIIPVGERVIEFKGMMMPNQSGTFLWNKLKTDITYDELLAAILEEYDIDEATARIDLNEFLDEARGIGALDE